MQILDAGNWKIFSTAENEGRRIISKRSKNKTEQSHLQNRHDLQIGRCSILVPSQKNMQQLLLVSRTSVSAPLAVCCTELSNDVVCKIVVPISKQSLVPTFTSGSSHRLCTSFPGWSLKSQCQARHQHKLSCRGIHTDHTPNLPVSLTVQNKMTVMFMKNIAPPSLPKRQPGSPKTRQARDPCRGR